MSLRYEICQRLNLRNSVRLRTSKMANHDIFDITRLCVAVWLDRGGPAIVSAIYEGPAQCCGKSET